jgi:hypothetical protein
VFHGAQIVFHKSPRLVYILNQINSEEVNYFEDLGIEGKILLKLIIRA